MGISDAKPDRGHERPGDKPHAKVKVEIDDTDNPLPAQGGRAGQNPKPPEVITGKDA